MTTTLLFLRSSSSNSARPHEQFLHAFFLRGAAGLTGSHAGTGRALSAGVRRDSASMRGVDDEEVSAQSACFLAGSGLRLSLSGTDPLDRDFSGTEALGVCAGFCAIIEPLSAIDDRTLNPARVSSEGRVWKADVKLRMCSVPRGVRPIRSCASSEGSFGVNVS